MTSSVVPGDTVTSKVGQGDRATPSTEWEVKIITKAPGETWQYPRWVRGRHGAHGDAVSGNGFLPKVKGWIGHY